MELGFCSFEVGPGFGYEGGNFGGWERVDACEDCSERLNFAVEGFEGFADVLVEYYD